ncbi:TolC family outer membrane protein [Prosthecochloris sp. N3]|uniref:TolC family outer membrane protein n=1 Tax=Prosthecochloris ethylica TaxID=2743976 RepID=A0ABR9XU98_9CHLB|nr:TolC family outer membrane protein [Prosthecochloris ethylica]MBF0586594.1 TolC family outer membrane protein [Prosthecochloris ethylica]MBF0637636.1 TolC family outer membrane protein [Prosthecochloris ethylica]NUK48643.1 TolC family outer membrane protein [Prosthecochloris ethylica]
MKHINYRKMAIGMLVAGLFAGVGSADVRAQEPVMVGQVAAVDAAEPAENTRTVRDIVEQVINNNPEVQAKWHEFQAAYHEEAIAYGGYFPKVDVSAGVGREWVDGDDIDKDVYTRRGVRLQVTQMLFDGFYTCNQVCRLKYAGKAKYYEFIDAIERVGLEALRAYADVQRYRNLVRLAEQNHSYHIEIYDQITNRVTQGVSTGVDMEQIEGRVALALSNLITERANLHDVTARYQRIVGELPPDELEDFEVPDEIVPESVESALEKSFRNNPGFIASLLDIKSAEHAVKVQESKFYPRFDLRGYHDWSWDKDGIDGYQREAVVEVVMNYNIFNGGSDAAAVRQYKHKLYQTEDLKTKACHDLRQTVEIAYNDKRSLTTQLDYLDQHRKRLDLVRVAYLDQFTIGKRTLLDLLDTENEYYQAQRAYMNGLFDLLIADARILSGMGMLLNEMEVVRYDLPTLDELDYTEHYVHTEDYCPVEAPETRILPENGEM